MAASPPASAEPLEPPQPQYGWREVWAGADATRDVWLLYSGITIAPFSRDIYSDGWRFRVNGGYGRYKYDYAASQATAPCGAPPLDACTHTINHYSGETAYTYSDVLAGYHIRLGELTAKAFVGASVSTHASDNRDPRKHSNGTEIGIKGAIELWLNLGEDGWTSLDASYADAHETSAVRWRAGWRVLPTVSIGPELRYDGTVDGSSSRAGIFARYEWLGGEVSAAGGVAGSMFGIGDERDYAPYGTLNVLFQY